ncbi:MAG: hypothetical protein ACKOAS_04825, partial [Verrucomicrobiota bacterium]
MKTLKFSVLIGAISAALALLLSATGLPSLLDARLVQALGIPLDGRPLGGTPYFFTILFAFGIAWTTVDISRSLPRLAIAGASAILICTWTLVLSLYGIYQSPVLPVAAVCFS